MAPLWVDGMKKLPGAHFFPTIGVRHTNGYRKRQGRWQEQVKQSSGAEECSHWTAAGSWARSGVALVYEAWSILTASHPLSGTIEEIGGIILWPRVAKGPFLPPLPVAWTPQGKVEKRFFLEKGLRTRCQINSSLITRVLPITVTHRVPNIPESKLLFVSKGYAFTHGLGNQ